MTSLYLLLVMKRKVDCVEGAQSNWSLIVIVCERVRELKEGKIEVYIDQACP